MSKSTNQSQKSPAKLLKEKWPITSKLFAQIGRKDRSKIFSFRRLEFTDFNEARFLKSMRRR